MDGVLAVDKPAGMTSHDVVAAVRKAIRNSGSVQWTDDRRRIKVGHTGTLDPMATGLLFLCIGRATKSARLLEAQAKEYRVEIHLGASTTTGDAEGEILGRSKAPFPDAEQVTTICHYFEGEIQQIPPMFSAVKIGGQRLYALARRGLIVERPSRTVTISTLEILEYTPPFLRLRVVCSKGTYIRTLAEDIGMALGVGGHVRALQRSKIGSFSVERALSFDSVLHLIAEGRIAEKLLCIAELQAKGNDGIWSSQ